MAVAGCATSRSRTSFVDLGMSPLCESFLTAEQIDAMEPYYPLHVLVCDSCFLVQLQGICQARSTSSPSTPISRPIRPPGSSTRARYCEMIKARLDLGAQQPRRRDRQQRRLSAAALPAARRAGARHRAGRQCRRGRAQEEYSDAGRVLRPDARAAAGRRGQDAPISSSATMCWRRFPISTTSSPAWRICWRRDGVITLEFPHLERLIDENQFDTIYHEHFSYFSLVTIDRMAARHGLKVFDVEELPTHGGSLRVYLCRTDAAHAGRRRASTALLAHERADRLRGHRRPTRASPRRFSAPSASCCRS